MLSMALDFIKGYMPDWPEWALDLLVIMTALLVVTGVLTRLYVPEDEREQTEKETSTTTTSTKEHSFSNGSKKKSFHELQLEFQSFRRQYSAVYLVIMLADWMQGTHMYTLYLSYGVNISALFLTGFLSGALFAPFLGSFVDKFGRKRSCIVYCLLEIVINIMEHFDNFTILMIGRVMGGISTNLLFSAFESWMTTEHHKRGFPDSWISRTYSQCSVINGSMAVLAGIVAQFLEDLLGQIGPFQGAVGLTVLALLLVMGWEENYGEECVGDHCKSSLVTQFLDGWKTTISDSRIWRIGITQALSEGGMYVFVFNWVPTLLSLNPPGGVPTGCVFSALMMAITIGGMIIPLVQGMVAFASKSNDSTSEITATLIYLLGSVSMALPIICLSSSSSSNGSSSSFAYGQELILISFLVFECCVGMFMPVSGTLRSKYVPDALHGAILNIFRFPLNVVVVAGTYASDHWQVSSIFQAVSGCFLLAALLQATLIPASQQIQGSVVKPSAVPAMKKTN